MKRKAVSPDPDYIAEDTLHQIGDTLFHGLEKILSNMSSMSDIRLHSFIHPFSPVASQSLLTIWGKYHQLTIAITLTHAHT